MRVYAKKRKAFLEAHPFCMVSPVLKGLWDGLFVSATDIHHKAGRLGKNYLDESTWMAVSREGHDFIHRNPKIARERGWLI